ncbi:uncharacterized protein LOC143526423 isoform X2 [Brachyhypopomus gauderio]|uniref:uncharacterized protein LOC143526423 isoform X2 n=1 Tax=Brachyhypopomus gauderio TaxID=698409 RepID=UPI004041DF42
MERHRWNTTRSNLRRTAKKRVNRLLESLSEDVGRSSGEVSLVSPEKNYNYTSARLKLPEAEPATPVTGHGPTTPVTGHGPATPVTGHGPATPVTGHVTSQSSHDFASVLQNLLVKQEIILDQMKIMQRTLEAIQGSSGGPGEQDLDEGTLPLADTESLLHLESALKNEPELKNKMITALGLNGGVDLKDTVWRIMKRTVTNSLAKKLNWRGINGKMAFSSLCLKDVIAGAVRRNHLTRQATNQEIEFYVKKWLHLAMDREGGRKLRQERCVRFTPNL